MSTVLAGLSNPTVSRDRSKKRPSTPDAGFRSSAPSLSRLTGKRLMRLSWLSYSSCEFPGPHIVGKGQPSEPHACACGTPHAGLGSSDLAGISPDRPCGCGSYAPRGISLAGVDALLKLDITTFNECGLAPPTWRVEACPGRPLREGGRTSWDRTHGLLRQRRALSALVVGASLEPDEPFSWHPALRVGLSEAG